MPVQTVSGGAILINIYMDKEKKPKGCCGECGEPLFSLYFKKEGKLCDTCEDKRRELTDKTIILNDFTSQGRWSFMERKRSNFDRRSKSDRRKLNKTEVFF